VVISKQRRGGASAHRASTRAAAARPATPPALGPSDSRPGRREPGDHREPR